MSAIRSCPRPPHDIDCHLTRTTARPLPSSRVPSLMDEDGLFPAVVETVHRLLRPGTGLMPPVRPRWCDVPIAVFQWRRHSTWVWVIRGLFAVFHLMYGGRRRAINQFGCAVAPLLVFALMWPIVDAAQRQHADARLM